MSGSQSNELKAINELRFEITKLYAALRFIHVDNPEDREEVLAHIDLLEERLQRMEKKYYG